VFFGGVGRAKAEFGCDFRPCGRRAGALDRALHEVEDLLLAVGEFGRFEHGSRRRGRLTRMNGLMRSAEFLSSSCIFIQASEKCKAKLRKW
jgi:hypothetical protein